MSYEIDKIDNNCNSDWKNYEFVTYMSSIKMSFAEEILFQVLA